MLTLAAVPVLESVAVFLGIVVSVTALLGLLIQFTNKINSLKTEISYLKQELLDHAISDGHASLISSLDLTHDETVRIEKMIDLHIQYALNQHKVLELEIKRTNERIDRKFATIGHYLNDIQRFLRNTNDYVPTPRLEKTGSSET